MAGVAVAVSAFGWLGGVASAHPGHASCSEGAHTFVVALAKAGGAGEFASTSAKGGGLGEDTAGAHAALCEPRP